MIYSEEQRRKNLQRFNEWIATRNSMQKAAFVGILKERYTTFREVRNALGI